MAAWERRRRIYSDGLGAEIRDRGYVGAIVLASGDGTRLGTLKRDRTGSIIPKQFRSLAGGASLLEQTVARANSVVATERITAVVCAHHAQHWKSSLRMIDTQRIGNRDFAGSTHDEPANDEHFARRFYLPR